MGRISNNIELFDQYLNQELGPEEVNEIESRFHTDVNFHEEFQLYLQSMEVINKEGFRQQIDEIMSRGDRKKINLLQPAFLRGAAASITLLIAIFSYYFLTSTNPSVSYEPYPNILKIRTDAQSFPGIHEYSEGAYEQAIEKMLKIQQPDEQVRFYLAISLMMIKNDAEAIKTLLTIPDQSIFRQQKNWYLSILYYRIGDQENSLQMLQEIGVGDFKYKEAKTLVDAIE